MKFQDGNGNWSIQDYQIHKTDLYQDRHNKAEPSAWTITIRGIGPNLF